MRDKNGISAELKLPFDSEAGQDCLKSRMFSFVCSARFVLRGSKGGLTSHPTDATLCDDESVTNLDLLIERRYFGRPAEYSSLIVEFVW